jgi:hypothetical protein
MTAYIFDYKSLISTQPFAFDPAFKEWFNTWQSTHENYIVADISYDLLKLILGEETLNGATLVFPNNGDHVYDKGQDLTSINSVQIGNYKVDIPEIPQELGDLSGNTFQVTFWINSEPRILFAGKIKPEDNLYPLVGSVQLNHVCDDWQHTWELMRMFSP